jgi:hypothetical protein
VRIAETVIAAVFALLGVRSAVVWARRRFDGRSAGEHALYALYVTARVGMWFALSALFVLYATAGITDPITHERIPATGRAFVDAAREYAWFWVVLAVLAGTQLLSGFFLGHGSGSDPRLDRSSD